MTDETVSQADIAANLRALGLQAGDEVVVHSSLSSIGWVAGGPDTVVDALLEVVGSGGTVAVPTFTSGTVRTMPFDPDETESRTGAITEALRTRSNAHRSEHPTHSVAAIGAAAADLTIHHPDAETLGIDSPLHRLAKRGGSILLLGVGFNRNSTLHIAERIAGLPYKDTTRAVLVQDGDRVKTVEVAHAGCGKGFSTLEPVAEEAGILTRGRIGSAPSMLMTGLDLIDVALAELEADPTSLLCDEPDCWWCPDARERLRAARAND